MLGEDVGVGAGGLPPDSDGDGVAVSGVNSPANWFWAGLRAVSGVAVGVACRVAEADGVGVRVGVGDVLGLGVRLGAGGITWCVGEDFGCVSEDFGSGGAGRT